MSSIRITGDALWRRMENAVERVRLRTERVANALRDAGIPYAVSGGNAVRVWVSQIDEAAVRTTRDVDILLRRSDIDEAKRVLTAAGFTFRHVAGVDMFLDGPDAKPRDAVHIVYAGERVREDYVDVTPDLTNTEEFDGLSVVALEDLVRMKLTSFRRKDQVHLLDMLEIGLIDANWVARFRDDLAQRLIELIEDPDG